MNLLKRKIKTEGGSQPPLLVVSFIYIHAFQKSRTSIYENIKATTMHSIMFLEIVWQSSCWGLPKQQNNSGDFTFSLSFFKRSRMYKKDIIKMKRTLDLESEAENYNPQRCVT